MLIKPHHFVEIIKFYGNDDEKIKNNERLGSNFAPVYYQILDNPLEVLNLTIKPDFICEGCRFKINGVCTDTIEAQRWVAPKEIYNKELDEYLIKKLGLILNKPYLANELCQQIMFNIDSLKLDFELPFPNLDLEKLETGAKKYLKK